MGGRSEGGGQQRACRLSRVCSGGTHSVCAPQYCLEPSCLQRQRPAPASLPGHASLSSPDRSCFTDEESEAQGLRPLSKAAQHHTGLLGPSVPSGPPQAPEPHPVGILNVQAQHRGEMQTTGHNKPECLTQAWRISFPQMPRAEKGVSRSLGDL